MRENHPDRNVKESERSQKLFYKEAVQLEQVKYYLLDAERRKKLDDWLKRVEELTKPKPKPKKSG